MHDVRRLKLTAAWAATFVVVLWAVYAGAQLLGVELYRQGVWPRRIDALPGVLLAPLIHGSWVHLFSNTMPLLVLGTAMFYGFPRAARVTLPAVWLGSGLAVWLFARASFHIGASGLAFGAMFFVLAIGILRRDRASIALVLLVFFLHGSMIWGVLPQQPDVSFEYHLSGALVGLACAVLLRRSDPLPERVPYEWELEDEADESFDAAEPPGEVLRPDGTPDDEPRRYH